MSRKCFRCGRRGHFASECRRAEQARRLRAVPDPVPEPERPARPADPWDLSNQPPINQDPDLSRAHAYWDQVAPLPQPEPDKNMTLVQVARERRLRALAAEQVAESRAARAVI